jgi:hypothetical protein
MILSSWYSLPFTLEPKSQKHVFDWDFRASFDLSAYTHAGPADELQVATVADFQQRFCKLFETGLLMIQQLYLMLKTLKPASGNYF